MGVIRMYGFRIFIIIFNRFAASSLKASRLCVVQKPTNFQNFTKNMYNFLGYRVNTQTNRPRRIILLSL